MRSHNILHKVFQGCSLYFKSQFFITLTLVLYIAGVLLYDLVRNQVWWHGIANEET